MTLLAGATLTGITNKTWNDAGAELAGMLEIFTAYSEVLDRAAAMLGRTRRPVPAALAAVATLLTGPSVRLAAAPGPSVSSDLYTVGRALAVLTFEFTGYSTKYKHSLPDQADVPLLAEQESFYRLLRRATDPVVLRRFMSAPRTRF
jgi:hypothetical protein